MFGRCTRRGYEGETDGWRAFVAVQPINQETHLLGADAAVRKYAFLLQMCGDRGERRSAFQPSHENTLVM